MRESRQLVAIAAYESGHKSDRVKRANKRLAEQGAWPRPCPVRIRTRRGIDPGAGGGDPADGRPVSRRRVLPLHHRLAEPLRHPAAARGLPGRRGCGIRTRANALSSARISGQRAYAPDTRADPAGGREILGPGDWEPRSSPREETAQIRAISLADPTRRRTTPARPTLLGGIARCGKCGAGLTIAGKLSPTGNTQRYTCQK